MHQPYHVETRTHIPDTLITKWVKACTHVPHFNRNNDLTLIREKLKPLETHGKVYVLFQGTTPIAFIGAYFIDSLFYGQKGAYTPEYGFYLSDDAFLNATLFASLYDDMKLQGHTHHVLSNIFKEHDVFLHDFAYAMVVKDGIARTRFEPSLITLERVTMSDAKAYLTMVEEHESHMSKSPIFLGAGYDEREALESISSKDVNPMFLVHDGAFIGYTTLSKTQKAGSELLKTSDSLSVKGTHILEEYQNKGFGKEMIKAIKAYAHGLNYSYVVTDFECYNIKANIFWPKHFEIVMTSHVRYLGGKS